MKAWQVATLGEPRERPARWRTWRPSRSVPGSCWCGCVAAAANFPDVLICRGQYQVRPPLPFTPGVELCGEVLAVGRGWPVSPWATGSSARCVLPHGGFAEQALMEAATTFPAPAALDDAQAAALYIGYQTGWFGLHRRARLQPGETLLVHAAAGGVGQRRGPARQGRRRAGHRRGRRARKGRGGAAAAAPTSSSTGIPRTSWRWSRR